MSMSERAGQRWIWIGITLLVAMLVHLVSLYAIPRMVMRRVIRRMGPPNTIRFGGRPIAGRRGIARPSPDMLYASCPFDLSQGPLQITAHVPHSTYWSVSAFDSATNNFFVRNDRQVTGDSIEVILMRHGQPQPQATAPEHAIVFAPTQTGVVLFRTVIDDEKNLPALTALLHQDHCETVATR
jgi:uncharacterized membrane protein